MAGKTIGGVTITHPERRVFGEDGPTKGEVAAYYEVVAPWMLPELRGRPLSLVRCPQGSAGPCFFQKHHADTLGPHVKSVDIEEKDGEKVVVGQTATLELTPEQAEILTVAQQMSDRPLTLALRSIADSGDKASETNPDAIHLITGTRQSGAITVVKNGVPREINGVK